MFNGKMNNEVLYSIKEVTERRASRGKKTDLKSTSVNARLNLSIYVIFGIGIEIKVISCIQGESRCNSRNS